MVYYSIVVLYHSMRVYSKLTDNYIDIVLSTKMLNDPCDDD